MTLLLSASFPSVIPSDVTLHFSPVPYARTRGHGASAGMSMMEPCVALCCGGAASSNHDEEESAGECFLMTIRLSRGTKTDAAPWLSTARNKE